MRLRVLSSLYLLSFINVGFLGLVSKRTKVWKQEALQLTTGLHEARGIMQRRSRTKTKPKIELVLKYLHKMLRESPIWDPALPNSRLHPPSTNPNLHSARLRPRLAKPCFPSHVPQEQAFFASKASASAHPRLLTDQQAIISCIGYRALGLLAFTAVQSCDARG